MKRSKKNPLINELKSPEQSPHQDANNEQQEVNVHEDFESNYDVDMVSDEIEPTSEMSESTSSNTPPSTDNVKTENRRSSRAR
jgi:hypothetical protein